MTAERHFSHITATGGQMIRWNNHAAVMLLATVSALALSAGAVGADDISTAIAGPVSLDETADHTITATGAVVLTGSDLPAVAITGDYGQSFVNDGTIRSEGLSIATGTGLLFDGDVLATGAISNSGTIAMTAGPEDAAEAYGIRIDGALEAGFDNTGTISATATAPNDTGTGIGVIVSGAVTGDIVNTGTITGVATGTSSALGVGIRLAAGMTAGLTNSGTITAAATDGSSSAQAYGIYLSGAFDGALENSGSIVGTATNTAAGDASLFANGILINGSIVAGASLSNTGSISATATNLGTANSVRANGVEITNLAGTFSNEGSIVVDLVGAGFAINSSANGLYIGDLSGEITNLGHIAVNARGAREAYALYLGTGSGTVHIDTDDRIDGLIGVSSQNITLTANGSSNVFFFEDRDTGSGTFTTANDTGSTWFIDGEGSANATYAAVVNADMDISSAMAGDYGRLLEGVSDRLDGRSTPVVTRDDQSFDLGVGGMRPFVAATVERAQTDGDDSTNAADITLTNATFGYAGQTQSGVMLSGGLGAFSGTGASGPSDFDSTGFYGGLAIGRMLGSVTVQGGAGFGTITTENSRAVGGSSPAKATFDSQFATVHVGAQRDVAAMRGADITGFGTLRYTQQTNDGYTETGSTANATIGARSIGVTEATLGIKAAYATGNKGRLTGAAQIVSRSASGDSDIEVTVFGNTAPLDAAGIDYAGLGLEIGYTFAIIDGAELTLDAAQEFGDGGQGPTISAGISWAF